MSEKQYLAFFETSGNQAYVYATNKLRENIGASELTYRAGTEWVLKAAGFSGMQTDNPPAFREWLNKHNTLPDKSVEVILSTSGKSLLLLNDEAKAKAIISKVTEQAVREAPGLSITGAIVELRGRDKESVAEAMKHVHERFNRNRDLMPTPAQRFAMLPFCEPCATSGLPASANEKKNADFLAEPALKKREVADQWFQRIRKVFKSNEDGIFISSGADQLETEFEDLSWLGVMFSDGNGLGQIMMKFKEWLDEEDYLSTLRAFSIELDAATEAAFYAACQHLVGLDAVREMNRGGKRLPVVPLLLGGDDVTVLVDGRYALPFTNAFLKAFEVQTGAPHSPTIARIAEKALGAGRLSAGAGVAIVKKHFPFHSAHSLAETLLKSAKQTKKEVRQKERNDPFPCSSLDFHILFDAAFSSLDDIRTKRRTAPAGEKLWSGPYVVTSLEKLGGAQDTQWAESHHLDKLISRVEALAAVDDEGRYRLPSSQTHMLREAVAQGKAVADARIKEVKRLERSGLDSLYEDDGSFFTGSGKTASTRFLDALTSAEFWAIGKSDKQAEKAKP